MPLINLQTDPELAQAISGGDLNRLQDILRQRHHQKEAMRRKEEEELVGGLLAAFFPVFG